MTNEVILRNYTDDELLRYADRSNPEVAEIANRLGTALDRVESAEAAIQTVNLQLETFSDIVADVFDKLNGAISEAEEKLEAAIENINGIEVD